MKTAIVGCGGLGAALARGLVGKCELTLVDRHPEKLAPFFQSFRTRVLFDPVEGARGADVVLLCVKPAATRALAASLEGVLVPDALLVSCAAGIELRALRPRGLPVARAMPNIGAAEAASTTAVFFGPGCALPRDRERIDEIFGAVGTVRVVPDESWLHLATAIAASGPAFLLIAVEALVEGGVLHGLPREDALTFATGALRAAAARLEEGVEPSALRAQVTSPNGTTAAGLARLDAADVRAAFVDAVAAAVARSRELAG
jgi:pyrroline-5-carboxylate reductase